MCPRDTKRVFLQVYSELYVQTSAVSFNMDQVDSVEISYLDFEPSFGSVYATWRLFCKAISLKLAQKGVILLPFSMLVCQVDP